MPDSHPRSGRRQIWEQADYSPPPARDVGVPGRRTVTITGHGAEGHASRNGTRPSAAIRHRQVPRHERAGFRPDRTAMWAVLLGLMLILAAAASSHAAVLDLHYAARHLAAAHHTASHQAVAHQAVAHHFGAHHLAALARPR